MPVNLTPEKLSQLKPPYVFLDTARKVSQSRPSFLFTEIKKVLQFRAQDCPRAFFNAAERYLDKGYWLCGFFSYEFGYFLEKSFKNLARRKFQEPLAWLAVSDKPAEAVFESKKKARPGCEGYNLEKIKTNISQNEYRKKIKEIKNFIEQGLTYQVNYTFKIKFKFTGSVFELYRDLRNSQAVSYAALINMGGQRQILSFSPELFIALNNNKIKTSPMKGTAARGVSQAEDKQNKTRLTKSEKIKAENLMIVDLLRNDLGRIAKQVKTVKLFSVEKYQTLYQMTSTIEARLAKESGPGRIFASTFPCGSVTGAPKIKTMEIISRLEKEPRGVYTGAIGYFAPRRKACFNVAIRTIDLIGGEGEMGVGGGIVYDSKAASEYKEALLKADFFKKVGFSFQLFETMLWSKRKGFWLLDLHFRRLEKSCRYFGFSFSRQKARNKLKEKVKGKLSAARVKLLVNKQGGIKVEARKLDKLNFPVTFKVSSKKIDPENIFLYHKTTQRQFYNRERKKANREGFFEVIFLNKRNQLAEGSISNIFLKKGRKLYTPCLESGLLPGVLRQHLIETKKAEAKTLNLKDLKEADKIYLGNSVRGLMEAQTNYFLCNKSAPERNVA